MGRPNRVGEPIGMLKKGARKKMYSGEHNPVKIRLNN
jgi:hypothetical protein